MTEDESRKRVTLADVARATGVSPAAVSLAVRGEPGSAARLATGSWRPLGGWVTAGSRAPADRRACQVTVGLIIGGALTATPPRSTGSTRR